MDLASGTGRIACDVRRQFILERWNEFQRMLLSSCPAEQRAAMRCAFYAGSEAVLRIVFKNLTPGPEPTDEDLVMMQDLEAELRDFAERIQKGIN